MLPAEEANTYNGWILQGIAAYLLKENQSLTIIEPKQTMVVVLFRELKISTSVH